MTETGLAATDTGPTATDTDADRAGVNREVPTETLDVVETLEA